jgi:hypothetical protein
MKLFSLRGTLYPYNCAFTTPHQAAWLQLIISSSAAAAAATAAAAAFVAAVS